MVARLQAGGRAGPPAVAAADRPTGIAVLLVVMGCTKRFYVNLVYLQNRSL